MERCVVCGKLIQDDDVHYNSLFEPICPACALGFEVKKRNYLVQDYLELIEEV
jgi:hypothetical protein